MGERLIERRDPRREGGSPAHACSLNEQLVVNARLVPATDGYVSAAMILFKQLGLACGAQHHCICCTCGKEWREETENHGIHPLTWGGSRHGEFAGIMAASPSADVGPMPALSTV